MKTSNNLTNKTIAIIGVGRIGEQLVKELLCSLLQNKLNFVSKIIGICKNQDKLDAQFSDLLHTLLLNNTCFSSNQPKQLDTIYSNFLFTTDYKHLKNADLIITCFSVPLSKDHKSRKELLNANAKIAKHVATQIRAHCIRTPVLINLTNPVDVITWYLQDLSKLPKR